MLFVMTGSHVAGAESGRAGQSITQWEIQWIRSGEEGTDLPPDEESRWIAAAAGQHLMLPQGMTGVWIRLALPPADSSAGSYKQPALLIDRLYGREVSVYAGGEMLHQSTRTARHDRIKLFTPLPAAAGPAELLIRIETPENHAGITSDVRYGEFETLMASSIRMEMPDMALSSGMFMLGLVMLLCSGFLMRSVLGFWLSLAVIALTAGTIVFTYSPLPYMLFEPRTAWLPVAFDVALFIAAPAFMYFADIVFQGKYPFFKRLRHGMWVYAALCLLMLGLYNWQPDRFEPVYDVITVSLLGVAMLGGFAVTAVLAVATALRGNWHGTVLSCGIFGLTAAAATDMVLYYFNDGPYDPMLWKFGTLVLLVALIIILAGKIVRDHTTAITYAKERELYNLRLQRAEKLKIISDLAASVAHEVRNPLQVTRGFLQLLAEKEVSNREYYDMAIEELDRASSIITDFLTFAKPEMEEFTVFDVADELDKIHAIMKPHASLNGVTIRFDVYEGINIEGNASRFKQAIINFIKNGIEAIEFGGEIELQAFEQEGNAVIRIRDNGSGMDADQIAKLGTPYFSTKTKGTGLGLMVTFRIIEAMNGTISFDSELGKGTEVTLRFPIIDSRSQPV